MPIFQIPADLTGNLAWQVLPLHLIDMDNGKIQFGTVPEYCPHPVSMGTVGHHDDI